MNVAFIIFIHYFILWIWNFEPMCTPIHSSWILRWSWWWNNWYFWNLKLVHVIVCVAKVLLVVCYYIKCVVVLLLLYWCWYLFLYKYCWSNGVVLELMFYFNIVVVVIKKLVVIGKHATKSFAFVGLQNAFAGDVIVQNKPNCFSLELPSTSWCSCVIVQMLL